MFLLALLRRRFKSLRYVFFGLLCGSSVYFLTHESSVRENRFNGDEIQNLIQIENEKTVRSSELPVTTEAEQTETPAPPTGIAPFPPYQPPKDDDISVNSILNRTLDWLDLWNDDANCTGYQVRLLDMGSHPEPGALVSFPGSGNSWLRMLLMGLTGVFVHSVYAGDDATFQSKANTSYEVGVNCGCTLLQKTHDFALDATLFHLPFANRTHTLEQFKRKGILVIRNPYNAIRSYRNFDYGGMQGMAPESAFEGRGWDGFVSRSVAEWETLASVWIRGLEHGGVVYYERLRKNTRTELIRLAKMMGLTYDEDRLNCVLKHAEDNTFKRDSRNATQINSSPYTPSQRSLIHKAVDYVQDVLKERGLDPLPVEYYDQYHVHPEYGYVT